MQDTDFLILLADDDEDDRQFLMDAFAELPQTVSIKTFDNGVALMDALLKRDKKRPDMIFLDLFMPLMDGEECLNDIKDETRLSHIPVVIYAMVLDLEKAAMLRDKGAARYLQKSESFDALKNALTQCLSYINEDRHKKNNSAEFIIKY